MGGYRGHGGVRRPSLFPSRSSTCHQSAYPDSPLSSWRRVTSNRYVDAPTDSNSTSITLASRRSTSVPVPPSSVVVASAVVVVSLESVVVVPASVRSPGESSPRPKHPERETSPATPATTDRLETRQGRFPSVIALPNGSLLKNVGEVPTSPETHGNRSVAGQHPRSRRSNSRTAAGFIRTHYERKRSPEGRL